MSGGYWNWNEDGDDYPAYGITGAEIRTRALNAPCARCGHPRHRHHDGQGVTFAADALTECLDCDCKAFTSGE